MNQTEQWIELAIAEDLGDGDHTSMACIPEDAQGRARLLVKEDGVLSGMEYAKTIFSRVDPSLSVTAILSDGDIIKKGDIAFTVEGSSRSILAAERLVLNVMQRMSGIATVTHRIAESICHTRARILDTRKTTPVLRKLEKEAVLHGGGTNHRIGLYDMILIKDNHIDYAGGIAQAIERTKEYLNNLGKDLRIEVEARDMEEVRQILGVGGVDRIMLDNFAPSQIVEAVSLINGQAETEASGGIHEGNIVPYAEAGVDFISMGALTHSVKSLDLSLKAY
ncbi:MAG: carboxylating nicotinate-nucleotide diphosphorylase [Flavobacteriales bacterium]|nr:carboxylating nicotinate-nucleotide diphosphorylase [Flavobacteriales bacterium]